MYSNKGIEMCLLLPESMFKTSSMNGTLFDLPETDYVNYTFFLVIASNYANGCTNSALINISKFLSDNNTVYNMTVTGGSYDCRLKHYSSSKIYVSGEYEGKISIYGIK